MKYQSMKDGTRKQIEDRAPLMLQYYLQHDAFAIQSWFPAGKSQEITKDFFKNIILPLHKTPNPRKTDQKLQDFCCLVANLFYSSHKQPLKVDLNSNAYNNKSAPSRYIIDLVKILHDNGYIEKHTGFFNKKIPEKSRVTRIYPTKKMIEALFGCDDVAEEKYQVVEDREIIILRADDKDKTQVKYRNTKFTNKLRKELQFINEVNRRFSIVHSRPAYPAVRLISDLHAVFNNGTFEDGGRFYTGINGYQGLYRAGRAEITINGSKTVELDYSGLHPHILYAKVGIQAEGDQYNIVNPDKKLRPVLKNALLALLNAESEALMVSAGNNFLHENFDYYDLMQKKGLMITDLLELFKVAHPKIAKFFCTGQGVKLMNIDAEIARIILLHFASMNEACLCIHDSFIVEAKNKDILHKLMADTYQQVISKTFKTVKVFTCPVKPAFG